MAENASEKKIADEFKEAKHSVIIKVGMLGDTQIGKTTLMVKYIDDTYDEDFIETLGINFKEKTIKAKNANITISVWDLGGGKEFAALMPLVVTDAKVVLFAFDLTQKQSLFSVKRWYKEAKKENKIFMPFLIGTKYDLFEECEDHYKQDITKYARKFAKKMSAPLIYCSSAESINVKNIFKVIINKVFDLKSKLKEAHDCTKEALLELDPKDEDEEDGKKKKKKKKKKKDKKKKGKKSKKKKKKKDKEQDVESDNDDEDGDSESDEEKDEESE